MVQKQEKEKPEAELEAKQPVQKTTKAGKHSKKSQQEAEASEQKQAKKAQAVEESQESTKKPVQKPRVIWRSKNQKAARELVELDKFYTVEEALALLPKLSKTKFDATAELHVVLDVDTKQADQNLRVSAALPAGTGKSVKVAVLADEKESAAAKAAGADQVDGDTLLQNLAKGKLDFDVLVATPAKMSELGKYAKVLGPKGLMPSPKNNTVTNNPAEIVAEIKKGRVEVKNDPAGIVHVAFGKLSFQPKDLESNLRAVIKAIRSNKPSGVKGTYVKSMYISATMSPSIPLDTAQALK